MEDLTPGMLQIVGFMHSNLNIKFKKIQLEIKHYFNPISEVVLIASHTRGGVSDTPPLEIKEGVVLGPILLSKR